MADLSTMTGDGGTIILGGQTFLLRRLSIGDYGKIREWLKEQLPRPFQVVSQALIDLAPLKLVDPEAYEASRMELMISAAHDAKNDVLSNDEESIKSLMHNPKGIAFVLWLSIRGEHPTKTYEEIYELLLKTDVEKTLEAAKRKLDNINGLNPGHEDILFSDPTDQAKMPT